MASLGLLASYGGGSSSESESEDEDSSGTGTSTSQPEADASAKEKEKLPSPFVASAVSSASGAGLSVSGSVFSNPFLEAEKQQASVLEKHVKMTTPSNKVSALNGRQICWNYRKGRCRFGHNCKFAHDSDVPLGNRPPSLDDDDDVAVLQSNQSAEVGFVNDAEGEISEAVLRKRKKRAGLAQGLIPPKKALKAYFGQQASKFIVNK